MATLKGLKVVRKTDHKVLVFPLFYAKGTGTRAARFLGADAPTAEGAAEVVTGRLLSRGDLKR